MRIIGCDLHAAQQTIAMLECDTGERIERTLKHEGSVVRDFYASLAPPVVVMTAAADARRWAQEIGALGVVPKPFAVAELVSAVERYSAPAA